MNSKRNADTQVLTIVIAILASLGALIYNNSRITDVGKRIDDQRDSLGKRIDEQRDLLGKRIDDLRISVNQHVDDKFTLIVAKLDRMEDNLTRQIADLDGRLAKLEHHSE